MLFQQFSHIFKHGTRYFYSWRIVSSGNLKCLPNDNKTTKYIHSDNETTRTDFALTKVYPLAQSKTFDLELVNLNRVYEQKSTSELVRALFVLRVCAVDWIADNSFALMSLSRRILPNFAFRAVFGPTLYRQFVAGDSLSEIQATTNRLEGAGIQPMVAVSIEDDYKCSLSPAGYQNLYEKNLSKILECVAITSGVSTEGKGTMQVKVTALVPNYLLHTITDILRSEDVDQWLARLSEESSENFSLLFPEISREETTQLVDGLNRLDVVAAAAASACVRVLIDAEYVDQNIAIAFLSLFFMKKYNRNHAIIWNTYQCYLKESKERLRRDLFIADRLHFCHGAKIVRGAYMEKERYLAKKRGNPSPVWETKEQTDRCYDETISFLCSRAHSRLFRAPLGFSSYGDSFVVATHNEKSVRYAVTEARHLGLPVTWNLGRSGLYFAQLYGMCDYLSFALAQGGYPVFKSLPYGNMEEVLPYLSRRSQENKFVIRETRKENILLIRELKMRFKQMLD